MGLFKQKKNNKTDRGSILEDNSFIAIKNKISSAGYDSDFVYNCLNKSIHLVPKHLSFQLKQINKYQTLEEHLSILRKAGWQNINAKNVLENLTVLSDLGLIHTKSETLKIIENNNDHKQNTPKISAVSWVTLNRITELKRSVKSFILNNKDNQRSINYYIYDCSSPNVSKDKKRMLSDISKKEKVDIYYADENDKRIFFKKLLEYGKEDGLSESLLEFAFFDPFNCKLSFGKNRNSLLIGTLGELVLSTDDDTICNLTEPKDKQEGLQFNSNHDPTEIDIFPDRDTLLKNTQCIDKDILAVHEKMLGKKVVECVSENSQNIDLTKISQNFDYLIKKEPGQVLTTLSGFFGDSGMLKQSIVFGLKEEQREKSIMSKSKYISTITSKETIRMVVGNTICHSQHLMAANIGLDNRHILPPFFPIMRNEDGVFGAILHKCFQNSFIGHIPLAVYHNHPLPDQLDPKNIHQFSPRISEIQNLIINTFNNKIEISDPQQNLIALGNHITEIAKFRPSDFYDFLHTQFLSQISPYIHYLENLLNTYNHSPKYWADDLIKYIDNIQDYILGDLFLVPSDLLKNRSIDEAKVLCQKIILSFGELLSAWPLIIEKAKQLKQQGGVLMHMKV